MKKRIFISVSALLILAVIFALCSALVEPKYTDLKQQEGRLIGEYYAEAGGHDVIFIGDCEVYESFVPAVMWEKYGISSYIRGSAQQLAWHSYYLLEETFKYETPKAVVFNVLALKYGDPQSEAYNRMTLDGMKWSDAKIKAIAASMTEDESFLDYVFPLLRYHSRITELTGDDFKYAFKDAPAVSHSGYLMQTDVVPMPEGDASGITLTDYTLPETSMEYLEKMRALCEKNGSELILIKAPTNSWRYWWYDEWDAQIIDYAEENGLAYYNFIPLCEEIGIDWSTDTYDAGLHLNVYGAEKLSDYFGDILAREHGITDRRSDSALSEAWQGRVDRYYEDKNLRESE
ncbi:MAG: SGNH/GDSL hydrolase family protein [Clostridia bacterium]|nr:SGNH/GDSL hydrolase family protein [Clostridia bacterium]